MKVAGLQLDTAWEDPDESFHRAEVLAAEAVAGGAQLLVLPEMFATGFSMAAEQVARHASATREFLADLARRRQVWTLGGYAAPGPDRPVNACSLFAPDGKERLSYHKIHPFSYAGEHEHFAGGGSLPTAPVGDIRLTALICYDLRFPEPFRAAAADTDLFVVIANWPNARRAHWTTLLAARAIEEQAYVLGVNRVGEGDGLVYAGDSTLLDPLGQVQATLAETVGVVAGEVDPDVVAAARVRFSFLDDRRPEVYARIAAERA